MDRATVNRLVLFAGVALAVGALDLGTKQWASDSLARLDHPLPMKVGPDFDGRTLGEFLAASEHSSADVKDVLKLEPSVPVAADGLYPVERVTKDLGYYLFLEPDRSKAPMFVANPTQALRKEKGAAFNLGAWLSDAKAEGLKMSQVISGALTFVSEEEATALVAAGMLHPISRTAPDLTKEQKVAAGEVYLLTQRDIEIIPGLLRMVYAENPGAAWGFLGQAPLLVRKIVLQAFSFLAMLLLCFVVWKNGGPSWKLNSAALALIMGGALGNFIDRIGRDVVVDFIDMYVGESHWPTYNVADIGITVGVGLLIIQMLRKKSPF